RPASPAPPRAGRGRRCPVHPRPHRLRRTGARLPPHRRPPHRPRPPGRVVARACAVMPAVLQNRNYRIWLTGLSLANVGTWMQRIAQDWLVLQLTGRSGTALGIVTACQFLPVLAIGPFGGVLADRFDKRHTLLWTQAAVGACGAAL